MPETSISQQQIDDAHLQHFAGLGTVLPDNHTPNSITAPPVEDQSASPVATEPTQSASYVPEVTEITTKNTRPLWASPWPKLLLAGTGIFLIVVVLGLGLNNSMSGVTTQSPTAATTPQGDATPAPTADEQDGELKTKVAITTQAQELQNFNKEAAKSREQAKVKPVAKEPSANRPVARFTPQPVSPPVVAPPPERFVPRTTWQPVNTVQTRKPMLEPSAPAPVLNPMEQWNAAANIGSYGTVLRASNPPTADSESTDAATQTASTATGNSNLQASGGLGDISQQASTTTENSDWQPSGGLGNNFLSTNPDKTAERTTSARSLAQSQISQQQTPQPENNYQRASYSSDSSTLVRVGTRASGKLDTSIRWSGDSSQSAGLPDLLIKLVDPLKAADGSVAIPAESYLTVRVSSADTAGILQLSPVSVQFSNGRTEPLPEGAIWVFDKKGNTLQAKFHAPGTGKSFLSELGDAAGIAGLATDNSSLYVLNALGNRPRSQSRPSYFSLEKGTSVEIYVKASFRI